jgi:hypothetical protein
MNQSDKSYAAAVCLSGIFGIFGIHHFYLGRWIHGIIDLSMTLSGFTLLATGNPVLGFLILGIDVVHTFIITIMLFVGVYKDGNGNVVIYPGQTLGNDNIIQTN